MTIVIWDGKTLTSDRRQTRSGGLNEIMGKYVSVNKVFDLRNIKPRSCAVIKDMPENAIWSRVIAISYTGVDDQIKAFHGFLLEMLKEKIDVMDDIRNWVRFSPTYLEFSFILVVQNSITKEYGIYTLKRYDVSRNFKSYFTTVNDSFYAIGSGASIVNQWHKRQCNLSPVEYIYLAALHVDSCGDGYMQLDLNKTKIKTSKTYPLIVKNKLLTIFKSKILNIK